MQDNIYKREGMDKLRFGVKKTVDQIRDTYGHAGGTMVLEEDLYPLHSVTSDGKSIFDKIKLVDQLENIGSNVVKEAGDRADKESGDGRKTTALLLDSIFDLSQSFDVFPNDMKNSLDECIPVIHKLIDEKKRDITVDEVGSVATISSQNPVIGGLIQEVYQAIGKEGIIELDTSGTFETFYQIGEGVRLRNVGHISTHMETEKNSGRAAYKNPHILITRQKISTIMDVDNLFKQLDAKGTREIVIFCDEIDPAVVRALSFTHVNGIFKTLILKAPTLWKDWIFEDFAAITGATIVDPINGVTLATVGLNHLGTCELLTSQEMSKDRECETRVLGIKDITAHVQALEEKAKSNPQLKLRISWLQTKTAVLKVGAHSESDLSRTLKKARDACSASYYALKDGVVDGGGLCLFDIADKLPATIGGEILKHALKVPHNTIKKNMGKSELERIPFGPTVIDSTLVVKNAVKNAISIAGTHITAKGVIIIPNKPTS